MKKTNMKKLIRLATAILFLPAFLFVTSCSEDIDDSNLYTFTGETTESFLANRPDSFSNFNYILQRAGMDKILSAYGQYTTFAPLNDAVTAYVDSLYDDMSHPDNPHNGMTERSLEGLTDSLCQDIALFHLCNTKIMAVDMSGEPINTMLGRTLTTSVDSATGNTLLNMYTQITSVDNEVENGVVHIINHVITRSNRLLPSELQRHTEFSLMNEALQATGLADSLIGVQKSGLEEVTNTYNFYVPKRVLLGYTLFAETDNAFKAAGINSLDDLKQYAVQQYQNCSSWYDYVRDHNIRISTGTDYQNPWNCLNMFVRYHLLKCNVSYSQLVISSNEIPGMPLVEYYETMLPNTLLRVSGSKAQRARYLNRAVRNSTLTNTVPSTSDGQGGFGTDDMHEVVSPGIEIDQLVGDQPLNGSIHPIEGVLVYNSTVPQVCLNERMRFDVVALLPEMISNNLRCRNDNDIIALNGGKSGKDGSLGGGYVRCPQGFFDNLHIYNGNNTRMYYLPGQVNQWGNYQKDEFNIMGAYDFALRLPPVPEGTYELRIGFHSNNQRGMMQTFMAEGTYDITKMAALDIPLDMRIGVSPQQDGTPDANTGWSDWKTAREGDAGVTTDRNMHNLGWMRGPLFFSYAGTFASKTGRDIGNKDDAVLRRILTRRNFKQDSYWLRFKTALPSNTTTQFHLDYIELCPSTVYNNAKYLEDMY